MRGGDGDVVVEAEAHRAASLRVMAGGTDERERPLWDPPITRSTASMAAPAASSAISDDSGDVYVSGVEGDGPACRPLDAIEMILVVHPRELLPRRLARRHNLAATLAPLARNDVHHFGAGGRFGMARRRLMFGEAFGRDQNQGHTLRQV